MIRQIFKLSAIILSIVVLAGCNAVPYKAAVNNIAATRAQIDQAQTSQNRIAPPVVVKSGYYVDTNPISLKRPPAWLRQQVTVQANQIPLAILMNRLLRNSNATVSFDKTVAPNRRVSLNYTGTLQGALKTLAAETNYAYTLNSHDITWSAFETKTYNIAFMPGNASYSVGRSQSSLGNDEQQNSGAAQGAEAVGGINDQQYSSMEGDLSVWQDIDRTLNELKSKQGRVVVSESTTSVTVTDHPQNVTLISKYINQLNKSLSQQVGIKVQVLEVSLNKNYNFGIDWNLVAKTLGTTFNLSAGLGTATNIAAANSLRNGSGSGLVSFTVGNKNNNALLSALDKQGKLRVVTKPEVVTMNDQIASIRITQDTGYIASVSTSIAGGVGSDLLTTTITPGTVTDGFTLYVLPKIKNDDVFMQISSTISNLLSLVKESTEPTGGTTDKSKQQFSAIELPTIAEKSFNQRSVVKSGNTLVIAGYKRLRDQTSQASLFGVKPLGGKGSQSQNVETLVLITPIIMRTS